MSADAQTWRAALAASFGDVDRAVEARRRMLVAALDAGLSLRAIADVTGVSFNTIYRWAGNRGRRNGAAMVDAPVAALLGDTDG